MTDVASFRKTFLAFWRGRFQTLTLPARSIIAPQEGGGSCSQLPTRDLNRLEAISALGYAKAHNPRAYAVACLYDFVGKSRHPEKWARQLGISERSLHRHVEQFWALLYEHCHGLAPGEEKNVG